MQGCYTTSLSSRQWESDSVFFFFVYFQHEPDNEWERWREAFIAEQEEKWESGRSVCVTEREIDDGIMFLTHCGGACKVSGEQGGLLPHLCVCVYNASNEKTWSNQHNGRKCKTLQEPLSGTVWVKSTTLLNVCCCWTEKTFLWTTMAMYFSTTAFNLNLPRLPQLDMSNMSHKVL